MLGKGSYDENLKKNREETEAAGQRLGTAGTIASDLAGGVGGASAFGKAGITLLGRLAPTAGLGLRTAAGAAEGAAYGAAQGAGHTDTSSVSGYSLATRRKAQEPGAFVEALRLPPFWAQQARSLRRSRRTQPGKLLSRRLPMRVFPCRQETALAAQPSRPQRMLPPSSPSVPPSRRTRQSRELCPHSTPAVAIKGWSACRC